MDFDGFDWDRWNSVKCTAHGLSLAEIEGLFQRPISVGPDIRHSANEQRFRAVGMTDEGRRVFVVFTWRPNVQGARLIRPISARYMHKREVEAYEKGFS